MHGHTVRLVFCFPFSFSIIFFFFFFFVLVFLFFDNGRDTYIYFPRHIMGVRFYLFIYPTGSEQSILSGCGIVNLVVYLNDKWIEGIHIFKSLSSH